MRLTKTASPVSLATHAALLATVSVMIGCGKTEEEDAGSSSRDIPGVVLLDDGEDDNSQTLDDEAGYLGFWYTFDDKHECDNDNKVGTTLPTPAPDGGEEFSSQAYASAAEAPPSESDKPNVKGLRIHGGGHTLWGVGLGVAFYNPAGTPLPYDLSVQGWTGIRFWARNTGPVPIPLGVQISDDFSEPDGGQCIPRDNSTCLPAQGCFDSAIYELTGTDAVGPEWRLYEIPFSNLQRGNWGSHNEDTVVPPGINQTKVYQLQFKVDLIKAGIQPNEFDLWLDNIGFTTGNPTPGPTEPTSPEPAGPAPVNPDPVQPEGAAGSAG